MAAKKVTTCRVELEFRNREAAEEFAMQVGFDGGPVCKLQEIDTFVCPHDGTDGHPKCGKPWPMADDDSPMSFQWYRWHVKHGYNTYCCDATRQDCEGV